MLKPAHFSDFETPVLANAELQLWRALWPAQDCADIEAELRRTLAWQQKPIVIFGREVLQPRLTAWYGDPDCAYVYSGKRNEPLPWTPLLTELRLAVELVSGARFNSVLANCYRNGQDSMGWHSDDEPELGPEPVIASLSFGAARRFCLQHRRQKQQRLELLLQDGDLLLMAGATQANYRHALPKTSKPVAERLNFTFRWIHPTAS
ncbi:alpha-ketoglutarate-dependent dioxygenase AlkB [Permianibacter sp. IMCC34836]|uniref:alpha-ketoglutarate-dependent dioxygenase AlkB family protein n=1 Tax=Permianibacter fluminis TaxID=2738515 RepID=UPI001552E3CA|nr:alpha-ketoglutarate-dependent dioxygenase AlkB [Permianibacter fluminis]NQD37058.1 alpha-ketoglutarate-dependent dioxygenase AlkB [Permianibacter fluminis]